MKLSNQVIVNVYKDIQNACLIVHVAVGEFYFKITVGAKDIINTMVDKGVAAEEAVEFLVKREIDRRLLINNIDAALIEQKC